MKRGFQLTPGGKIQLSENDVERQCLDLLRRYGLNPIRLHAGTFRSPDGRSWLKGVEKGTPDYCVPRFYVETKRPGKSPTPDQEQQIWRLREFWSLETAIVHGAEELEEWLREHKIVL